MFPQAPQTKIAGKPLESLFWSLPIRQTFEGRNNVPQENGQVRVVFWPAFVTRQKDYLEKLATLFRYRGIEFSPMVSGASPMCWRRAIKLAIGSNPRFGILRWWYNGLSARILSEGNNQLAVYHEAPQRRNSPKMTV